MNQISFARKSILFLFSLLIIGAFLYSCNQKPEAVAVNNVKPDDNRFTPVALTADGELDEPMNFEVLRDGKVYINERKGALKLFDPATKTVKVIANIPVNTKYTSATGMVTEAEEGFIGFTVDPHFDENHWAYLFYAHPTEKKDVLSRWVLKDDQLDKASEKVLLEIPTQREVCCHTGGGMTWDAMGNLYLTVGNNTGNVADKSQTDERPNRTAWDDQRGSGNTNDLRGKILRIHPEKDGTYTIPEGNLFPKGTPKTRPEIYIMGDRNPWRPSVDSKTGWLYWGEVGPDASEDSKTTRTGMDELNQARKPGNFGWPYFIGENRGYPFYNYLNDSVGPEKDPAHPINNSVNNTGLKDLPPAQAAFISYPYGQSQKFPEVGTGARCAVGGPIFHEDNFKNAKRPYPAYFENNWIAADFSRGWIMTISMKENGDYESMERFLPSYQPVEPIDIKFGSNGDLYVLEYGSNWFRKSDNAKLVRIEYNSGNRTPVVAANASAQGGAIPFTVKLSSEGTKDADKDSLTYIWKITPSPTGDSNQIIHEANPSITFNKPGAYTAQLTVSDPSGAKNTRVLNLVAGNDPPKVVFNIAGNKTFFFPGRPLAYAVEVSDKEDGSIDPSHVAVSADYVSEGYDYALAVQQERSVDASTRFAVAQSLIARSDCNNCHHVDSKSIGPMYIEIADKYKATAAWALDSLPKKIRSGGTGVWGTVNMPAHPAISMNDARLIVNYMLNVRDKNISTLPLKGNYTQKIPEGDNGKGMLIMRAAYTDKGATGATPLTTESVVALRSPQLSPGTADELQHTEAKMQAMFAVGVNALPYNEGYIAFKNIDLSGVKQLALSATANPSQGYAGGIIEIRLDGPTGELIGQAEVKPVNPFAALMSSAQAAQDAGGTKKADSGKTKSAGGAKPPAAGAKPPKRPTMQDFMKLMAGMALKVDIKETAGAHDLYFVFKNDKAQPTQQLMSFSNIQFNIEKMPQTPKP
jgi:cytochrome c